ncbi:hypothetical protein C0Z19_10050 [Trinickia soli]|uniref:Uncharacterized protein n=1 Tax=Trinickia soli TaxID=380675 RepID=A0A2N7W7A6_9BURK|nr:hypothetical protein C0Z19_10050 [Trinickia soli]
MLRFKYLGSVLDAPIYEFAHRSEHRCRVSHRWVRRPIEASVCVLCKLSEKGVSARFGQNVTDGVGEDEHRFHSRADRGESAQPLFCLFGGLDEWLRHLVKCKQLGVAHSAGGSAGLVYGDAQIAL